MSTAAKKARRTLLGLTYLTITIFGILAYNVYARDKTWLPGGAIDLAGGREIILTASNQDGTAVEASQLQQAIEIMRKRIDGSGVSEAEITTIGQNQIEVSLPGTPDPALLNLVKDPAQLQFRPLIYSERIQADAEGNLIPASTVLPAFLDGPDPLAATTDGTKSSYDHIDQAVHDAWETVDCTKVQDKPSMGVRTEALVACADIDPANPDPNKIPEKFILGPVEVEGSEIASATSGPAVAGQGGVASNDFQVALDFKSTGKNQFGEATTRLFALNGLELDGVRNRFAMVLDGVVISSPEVREGPITQGTAQISRPGMPRAEAELLANQLKYGSIPLQMKMETDNTVSATLGGSQLQSGLLAGGLGLLLVVIYSFLQYRALALVTTGSLVVAAALTMGTIGVMSALLGYRLSLAGVAGIIVSIGITADSFIVYFERVRDELREGRSLPAAIEHGWTRARRTIIASDAVSMIAAVVLYMTASGGVRGFAFTLGLCTVIDLIVVTRFTHPVLILLGTTKFFGGGHKFSGLDPRQLGRGAAYKGRGRVEAAPLTLAERKAAATRGES